MNSRRAIALYFILVLVAMTWVSWHASTAPTITSLPQYAALKDKEGINVIHGFVTVCSEPWGLHDVRRLLRLPGLLAVRRLA